MQSMNKPCYIIAEAGVNHNGSEELAFKLVDAAQKSGADAVKFQTFKTEKLVTKNAKKAEYQKKQTGEGDQFSMLKKLELSDDAHRRLADYCNKKGIEFLSTPFDEESADFLIEIGCKRIKIPSGELTNIPFIKYLAQKDIPMIISTGMATLEEVQDAVEACRSTREECGYSGPIEEYVSLLHCTSNYPTAHKDVNLLAMNTLANQFRLPVGYSDHTAGVFVAPIARALGAEIFEKHFTLDRSMEGPDHAASLEPEELKEMCVAIRETDIILGSPEKKPTEHELEVRVAARRSVTLAQDVAAGVILTQEMLTLMRPGDGISPIHLEDMVGKTLINNMSAGETLHWANIKR